ncbi:MAG: hypothetical protein WA737_08050 [Candidatus Acidiferrales bacterium]
MPNRISRAAIILCLAAACGLALGVAGCARKKVQAAAPVTAPPSAPVETKAPDKAPASPPKIDTQPAPAQLPDGTATPPTVPRPKPKKSSTDQNSDTSSGDQPSHPQAPQISPQLSPADQANYERKTGEDLNTAENNLKQASGKQLSATQQDLADKIRSFVAQSRDASKNGDWERAQNLAQKARLLSAELVQSL